MVKGFIRTSIRLSSQGTKVRANVKKAGVRILYLCFSNLAAVINTTANLNRLVYKDKKSILTPLTYILTKAGLDYLIEIKIKKPEFFIKTNVTGIKHKKVKFKYRGSHFYTPKPPKKTNR